MIEKQADLWTSPGVVVITTNGFVKKNGEAVMGRGCAAEAVDFYKYFPEELGRAITKFGNRVFVFSIDEKDYVTFPVKDNWYEKASLALIKSSAEQLRFLADSHPDWHQIWLPRPGCGNGKLDWATVKPVIEPILNDDRFTVVTKGKL